MASPRNLVPLPPCHEFRALSNLYLRFPWYSVGVQEQPGEVVVTLAPTDWRLAARRAAIVAGGWLLFIAVAWLLNPGGFDVPRTAAMGAVIYLWPLYFPLLRRLILRSKLPWLRFDKSAGVVHLFASSRQVPISEVVAICDVIVSGQRGADLDYIDKTYELQLLLRKPAGTEFVLLAGGWDDSAEKRVAPITSKIASGLGIPHYSVNAVGGTISQQSRSELEAKRG
jgi:hypothetical protein